MFGPLHWYDKGFILLRRSVKRQTKGSEEDLPSITQLDKYPFNRAPQPLNMASELLRKAVSGSGFRNGDGSNHASGVGGENVYNIGKIDRLVECVRNQYDGASSFLVSCEKQVLEAVPCLFVHRCERLIHEPQRRLRGKKAGNGRSVSHPS